MLTGQTSKLCGHLNGDMDFKYFGTLNKSYFNFNDKHSHYCYHSQAVCQAPMLSKIWNSFGNWCLELGEKTLSTSEDNRIALNAEEEQTLADIFKGQNVHKSVRSLIYQVSISDSCEFSGFIFTTSEYLKTILSLFE